jgi:hypothetical protein
MNLQQNKVLSSKIGAASAIKKLEKKQMKKKQYYFTENLII